MIRAFLFPGLVALLACGAPVKQASLPTTTTGTELAMRLEDSSAPAILDVRSEAEYAAGHVPGAILLPHDQLPARLDELEPYRGSELVVYCRSGRRAGIAEATLAQAGFTHLVHLEGDWRAWSAAGLPIER